MSGAAIASNGLAKSLQPGTRLGRYVIAAVLGQGGMATVYLAQSVGEAGFSKWVALKLIEHTQATLGADRQNIEAMFFDEARLAAKITHPNVSQIFDLQQSEYGPYIVMEFLHGQSLAAVLKRAWAGKGLALECVARVIADAARGLHAAHEIRGTDGTLASVVHRDVSPQNIFVLYDGIAKVVDFGIARWSERTVQETATQELRGKLRYMAPEQVLHETVDRRTDVFALGIVLWESTLGRRLFSRENPGAIVRAIVDEPIPAPSDFEAHYPPALEAVVMKALAKDPAERFQTAEEMGEQLEAFLQSNPTEGTSVRLATEMQQLFWHERRAQQALLQTPIPERAPALVHPPQTTLPAPTIATIAAGDLSNEPSSHTGSARATSRAQMGFAIAALVIIGALTTALIAQQYLLRNSSANQQIVTPPPTPQTQTLIQPGARTESTAQPPTPSVNVPSNEGTQDASVGRAPSTNARSAPVRRPPASRGPTNLLLRHY